jgi:hypothetical protein
MTDVEMVSVSVSAGKKAGAGAPSAQRQPAAEAGLSAPILAVGILTFALSLATLIIVAITLPRVNAVQQTVVDSSNVLESIRLDGGSGGACEAPLGLPGLESLTWSAITARAATQEMQFYLYEYRKCFLRVASFS